MAGMDLCTDAGGKMLKYTGIDGTVIDKEGAAIQRIKEHEPEEGYWVAFSGGKDSMVIYDLIKRAGVKYDAHFNMTIVDPPEVRDYIKKYYPEVIWERPKKSMFQLIRHRRIPPTRVVRYCCSELKELHGNNRIIVVGVRRDESVNRKDRQVFEQSRRNKRVHFLSPIVDWLNEDVWQYIRQHKMPYCKLYDEGYTRIGCIMCPLQGTEGMLKDAERFPKYYRAYLRAFDAMLKNKDDGDRIQWHSAEDVMHWWVYGSHKDETTTQEKLT